MADNPRQIMEATESFVAEVDGERFVVLQKLTRIAAEHPLAQAHPNRFRPIEGHLSYAESATATATPGERSRPEISDPATREASKSEPTKPPARPAAAKPSATKS